MLKKVNGDDWNTAAIDVDKKLTRYPENVTRFCEIQAHRNPRQNEVRTKLAHIKPAMDGPTQSDKSSVALHNNCGARRTRLGMVGED